MLEVNRKGQYVHIEVKAAGNWNFPFQYAADSEWAAILLRNDVARRLFDTMREIRREAYEQGWRDAKAKKTAKKDWFSGSLEL